MYACKSSTLLLWLVVQVSWLFILPTTGSPHDEPFSLDSLKPFLDTSKYLDPKTSPIKPFMELIMPKQGPTTTTTTFSPIEDLAQRIIKFPVDLPDHLGADLLKNSPLSAGNDVLQAILPAGQALLGQNPIKTMTQTTGKIMEQLSGLNLNKMSPENQAMYYEYRNNDEPYGFRSHKYFSRECHFRFACEVGKMLRPFGGSSIAETLEKNRFIQDLQSRYTRAITYGLVYNDCERYYCLLKQLFGGPLEFAGGMAELMNRIANPDMY